MRYCEGQEGYLSGQCGGSAEGVQMEETYLSDLQPSLLASPLTFWGSWQRWLQMMIT